MEFEASWKLERVLGATVGPLSQSVPEPLPLAGRQEDRIPSTTPDEVPTAEFRVPLDLLWGGRRFPRCRTASRRTTIMTTLTTPTEIPATEAVLNVIGFAPPSAPDEPASATVVSATSTAVVNACGVVGGATSTAKTALIAC